MIGGGGGFGGGGGGGGGDNYDDNDTHALTTIQLQLLYNSHCI